MMARSGSPTVDSLSIRWEKLRSLSNQIYGGSSTSGTSNGRPQVYGCTDKWIIVGTQSAEVLVFDWSQVLVHKFIAPPHEDTGYGAVTSVCGDSKRVAAGFANGHVIVWSISGSLLLTAHPLIQLPSSINDSDGHILGSAIVWVGFDGDRILSADNHGLVLEHYTVRLFIDRKVRSKKILGEYQPAVPTAVLAMCTVRLENTTPLLLCILTPQYFIVYSIGSPDYPRGVQFVLASAAQQVDVSMGLSGTLAWDPDTQMLAICWANTLKVMRLRWISQGKLLQYRFECTAERAWTGPESLVKIDFINSNILQVITVTEQLLVLDLDTLEVLHTESIREKHILHHDYYSQALRSGSNSVVTDSFAGSAHTQGVSLFLMGKYEFYCGTFTNWADSIMACLNQSQPVQAVKLALRYYQSDENLQLVGLGKDHRDIVAASMPDIILTLVRYTLEMDQVNISRLLDVCLDAINITGITLLEQVYDLVEPFPDAEILLLHKILNLALDGTISYLDPKIFKRMVEFLSEKHLWDDFRGILMSLDPSSLDLHLAFEVCNTTPGLEDIHMFLTGVALFDFITPLQSESEIRYDFLADSLCGRVYPTGRPMAPSTHVQACHDIYTTLFMGADHKLLRDLIQSNPQGLFKALDAAFEQTYLNEENPEHINRQLIVGVLRLVFQQLPRELLIYFSVFLARNIAKYQQFVVMTGRDLDKIFKDLCMQPVMNDSSPSRDDCELAVLSLLSVYKTPDLQSTISLLNEAKYFTVMEQLYFSKGYNEKLVETCLRHVKCQGKFTNFWSFVNSGYGREPRLVAAQLVNSCELLSTNYPQEFAQFTCRHKLRAVFDHLDEMPEMSRLAFLDGVAFQIAKGVYLPPSAAMNTHINLSAKHNSSHQILELLTKVYNRENDIQLPVVVDSLIEYKHTNALVMLLCRQNRDSEAMIYLLDHIENNVDNGAEARCYVHQGVELCTKLASRDFEEGVKMWQKLLALLVRLELQVDATIRDLIQCHIDMSERGQQGLATRVVAQLSETDGIHILRDFYGAIEQQKLLITVIKQIFDGMSYKDVVELIGERLKGWTLSIDGECEGCGEKVCGLGIDAPKLYSEWEKRQKTQQNLPSSDTLVVFRCAHVYHLRCLMRFEKDYRCTICNV